MKKTVWMMIKEVLIKENISFEALGRGLCGKSELSRYLNGERRMDRLLLIVLLQRIGKSPAKFTCLLTYEEYNYFKWKQEVCLAHRRKDWEGVDKLLQDKMAKDRSCNKVLQEQFVQIMSAVVAEKVYHDTLSCESLLLKAINRTVPDFQNGLKADTLLSVQEICAIVLWQRVQPDKEKSFLTMGELVFFTEKHYGDKQELVKIYPLLAAQYLKLLLKKQEYEQCLLISEKALDMIITSGYTSCLEIILNIYIEAAEQLGITLEANKRKKQLQAWEELARDIGIEPQDADDELYLLGVCQEIELVHEAISISRKELKYSQEKLSEDICSPETMSRIETGKQGPRKSTYEALAKKLFLPEELYFNSIETDSFEVLELQGWLEAMLMGRRWKEAEELHQKLRDKLNLEIKMNLQYVEEVQYSIERGLGRLGEEDRLVRLTTILRHTIPNFEIGQWNTPDFWKHYFKKEEMSILLKIADVLYMTGDKEEEAKLLKNMLQYYKKSDVHYYNHYRIVLLILGRLTSVFLELADYEQVIDYAEEGIQICFVSGSDRVLPSLVNNKADAMEHLGQKEVSLKYYRLAFYCADFMEIKSADISRISYEKLSGERPEWY